MVDYIIDFIPIYLICFFTGFFIWIEYRKHYFYRIENSIMNTLDKKIFPLYLLLILSIIIGFLYSFAPDLYNYLFPIDSLDITPINFIGIIILKSAFAWLVIYQVKFESLKKYFIDEKESHQVQFIQYSHKTLSAGLILMLGGLFITISSLAALLLFFTGLYIYNLGYLKK